MDRYDVELEPAEPDGSVAVVPALPGLLVFGRDVDEVLERVRAAIAFRVGRGPLPVRLAVSRQDRGELFEDLPGLSGGQGALRPRELIGDRPRFSEAFKGHTDGVRVW